LGNTATPLTLWRPAAFGDFRKKNAKTHVALHGNISAPGQSVKRHGKSSSLHLKKIFLLWGCRFFVSDVISGGLLGYLGPLRLALGANR